MAKFQHRQRVKIVDASSPYRGQTGTVDWLNGQGGRYFYGIRFPGTGQVIKFPEGQLQAIGP